MSTYTYRNHWLNIFGATALISMGLVSIASATSNFENLQDHQQIIDQTVAFIEQELQLDSADATVSVKSLDQRLRLHQCSQPLQAFWPPGAQKIGHTSIGIRCRDNKPWKIFVGAHIQKFTDVWITTTAIERGTILEDQHVKLERRDISKSIRHYFASEESPIGLITKRPLRAGDTLQMSAVAKQKLVKRGDRVNVVGRKNGLEIRTVATALSDGASGDRIRVRSLTTKKELEGILRQNSTVYVNI